MIKISALIVSLSFGMLVSYVVMTSNQVDNETLSIILSKLDAVPVSRDSIPLTIPPALSDSPTNVNSTNISKNDIEVIIRDVMKEFMKEQKQFAELNQRNNEQNVLTQQITKNLTQEQQQKQEEVLQETYQLLSDIISRGSLTQSNMEEYNSLLEQLSVSETDKLFRQLAVAINDGRVKPDPDVRM